MALPALLFFSLSAALRAQTPQWEQHLVDLYENEEEGATAMENAYEELTELAQQPIDINTASAEELMQIPVLNTEQVNDIMEYLYKFGAMKSIDELAMIPSIDHTMRLLLSHVLTAKPRTPTPWYSKEGLTHLLKDIRQEAVFTFQTPTYYRAGDINAPAVTSLGKNKYAGKYLGDPTKHSFRYSLHMGLNVTLNLAGGKTGGEPFGPPNNSMGYDQYAVNLSITCLGRFRRIIAGCFKAQYGMGLILNNTFTIGKQGMLTAMGRNTAYFSPCTSTGGTNYFQGLATTVDIARHVQLSSFLSYRNIDATLNEDASIATILNSGYHRTENEMKKKNNATMFTAGAHVGYSRKAWSIGLNFVATRLNRPLSPTYTAADTLSRSKLYRLYYPRGNAHWNVSVDYRYRWRDLSFSGETATGGCGQLATVNSMVWESPWNITFMAMQRYYAYQYNALHGNSFGENSAVQNESGIFVGAKWNVGHGITIDAYSDVAYFPWFKYRVSHSSYSWDNSATASCAIGRWTLALRCRIKTKQRDRTVGKSKILTPMTDRRVRLLATMANGPWSLRTHIEGCMLSYDSDSKGGILSQSVAYTAQKKWQIYASATLFNTDDYDSRLYTYERGMRYSFDSTSFYGKGIHGAVMGRCDISRHLTATAKACHTRYFDRKTIGTAERMIFSSYFTDLYFQLIAKF